LGFLLSGPYLVQNIRENAFKVEKYAVSFKDSSPQFEIIDIALIDSDPNHVRHNIPDEGLKGLANAIQKLGIIHPIIVRPGSAGRYEVIVGERRRQAALLAGETKVPLLIKPCSDEEVTEVRVFENIGLGVRSALEPRDMANAIQSIADRFTSPEEAAQYFGRAPTWLSQATAAANLSEKVTALLDSGKISSTGAAVQLEKLAKKNEAKAKLLIDQIEQMPEGEMVSKKVVDEVLLEDSPRAKKKTEAIQPDQPSPAPAQETLPASATPADDLPPWEGSSAPAAVAVPAVDVLAPKARVNPSKVKLVAELLGLSEEDEEIVLARLIDEFLALKRAQ
jgi:ParB family chromosome partitioning protein